MIVRTTPEALYLITQPDHAALARRVMERWTPLHDARRRASILLAVEQHDNGWAEADTAPMVDPTSGRVLDFITVPAAVRQAVWPTGVTRLAEEDEWAAALVAQHAITVYDRFRTDASWTTFFATMERLRDALAHSAGRGQREVDCDYAFVRIGDLISLVFCNRWHTLQTYSEWCFSLSDDHVHVTPDGFGGSIVPLAVRARQLPNRTFSSDAELQAALRAAPAVVLTGTCGA